MISYISEVYPRVDILLRDVNEYILIFLFLIESGSVDWGLLVGVSFPLL